VRARRKIRLRDVLGVSRARLPLHDHQSVRTMASVARAALRRCPWLWNKRSASVSSSARTSYGCERTWPHNASADVAHAFLAHQVKLGLATLSHKVLVELFAAFVH
jgi:hypothetical protein